MSITMCCVASSVALAQTISPDCPDDINSDGAIDFFDVLEFVARVDVNEGPCDSSVRLVAGEFDPMTATRNFTALRTLLASGGVIQIPSGVYHIQTPASGEGLPITEDGTSLLGTGNTTLIFSREVRNGPFGGIVSDGVSNIVIRGIRFQGVRDLGDPDITKWGRGPDLRGGSSITIEDCSFASFLPHNLCIGRAQAPAGSWIQNNNPNSQESIDALRDLLATDVVVENCVFDRPFQSGLCVFGVNGARIANNYFRFPTSPNVRPLDDCDVIGVIQGGGTAILVDDASQATGLDFYAFNENLSIIGNYAPAGLCDLTGTASAVVANNRFLALRIKSYDFFQQALNFGNQPGPFLALDFLDRDIQVAANFLDALCVESRWDSGGVGSSIANYRTQGTQVATTLAIVEPNCSDPWPSNNTVYCDRD